MLSRRILLFLLIAFVFLSCKKEFTPTGVLTNANKFLVVDGFINTGNDSTFIKLSITKRFDTLNRVTPVTGATIAVENDANSSFSLTEISPGTYAAPPTNLSSKPKYRLRIKTTDNKEYLSDFVAVKNSPPIDSVGFNANAEGVQVYVNTHDVTNNTRYYRWDFNEDWKFHSNLSSGIIIAPYYCYNKAVPGVIDVANTLKLSSDIVYQAPIVFIPSYSEKIEIRYSILVKQYALTPDAYSFWDNLNKNTTSLGSVFDAQPSTNQTNYHNTADGQELVIGYLSAGNYSSKRFYINVDQLPKTYKTDNGVSCPIDTAYYFKAPFLYPNPPFYSVDLSGQFDYIGLETYGGKPPPPFPFPFKESFTYTRCVNCTLRGNINPPAFWKN